MDIRSKIGAFAVAMALAAGIAPASAQSVTGPVAGKPVLMLGNFDLTKLNYVVEEFFLSGEAVSYHPVRELRDDGQWAVVAGDKAPYTTRLVVVRPTDPAKFNGTVLVEWLNVSAGTDTAPDWSMTHRELVRSGYAYVGVSAQKNGIYGGPIDSGMPYLKKADPARYASLDHPGDAYSFDIFTQAAKAVRGAGGANLLGPLKPKHVIASGESQSAGYLTTYIDAIDPITKAFDGYLVHSRFGGAARLEAGNPQNQIPGVKFRSDLRAPVMTFITETDLIGFNGIGGYFTARQPDTDRLRVWEVGGTAHADIYLNAGVIDSGSAPIQDLARAYAPVDTVMGVKTNTLVNAAPQHHYVMEAALSALNRWVVDGAPPPRSARLETTDVERPALVLDHVGNAKGGVRTPWMDAPTARLSGVGQTGEGTFSRLFGVTEPFDKAKLSTLYPGGRRDYLKKFDAALASAVQAGFILRSDESEIRALAAAMYPSE